MKKLIKNNYLKHQETIKNIFWRSLQIFGNQGITFLIFILCARLLNPYDFGIYSYILAVISLLAMFSDFGISTATSKYVAEYSAIDKNKLRAVLFNSLIIILSLGSIITLLTVFFGRYFLKEKYGLVLYALPLLFLTPIVSLYDGIFRGLKKFKELAIISMSVGLPSTIFVYFLVKNFGLIGALISQSLFYFILALCLFFVYKNLYFQFDKKLIKTITKYSLLIGISTIGYFLYTKADILILGHFGYVKEIGYYELINKFFAILILPFTILAQTIAPNITVYYAKKDYSKIEEKLILFLKRIIPLSILIAFLFYFFFPWLIKTFLSEYFVREMLIPLAILSFLIPAKIWGVFQTQSFIVATGYAKIITIATLIGGVLNVIFDIVFINLIGFVGVFWVTLIIHSLNILIVTIWFNKKIKQKNKK